MAFHSIVANSSVSSHKSHKFHDSHCNATSVRFAFILPIGLEATKSNKIVIIDYILEVHATNDFTGIQNSDLLIIL